MIKRTGIEYLKKIKPKTKSKIKTETINNVKIMYKKLIESSFSGIFKEGDVILDIDHGGQVDNMTKKTSPSSSNKETITYNFTSSGVATK